MGLYKGATLSFGQFEFIGRHEIQHTNQHTNTAHIDKWLLCVFDWTLSLPQQAAVYIYVYIYIYHDACWEGIAVWTTLKAPCTDNNNINVTC